MNEDRAVSVIVPCYNAEEFILETYASIAVQGDAVAEIIFVDDCSQDGTPLILESLEKRDGRVRVLKRHVNCGVSSARNYGVSYCKSPYIAFLDSDDIWIEGKLLNQLEVFDRDGAIGLVYCGYELMDVKGNVLERQAVVRPELRGWVFDELLRGGNLVSGSASAVVIRKRDFDRSGGFDERLKYGEDWDLWLRLSRVCKFDFCDGDCVRIRSHSESSQRKNPNNIKTCVFQMRQLHLILRKFQSSDADCFKNNYFSKFIRQRMFWNSIAVLRLSTTEESYRNLLFSVLMQEWAKYAINVGKALFWRFLGYLPVRVRRLLRGIYRRRIDKGVCVEIKGGLGNQLFQYIAALNLAERLNLPLSVDLGHYSWSGAREFALEKFFQIRRGRMGYGETFEEEGFRYDSRIERIQGECIDLRGYFQSPKYFVGRRDAMVKAFERFELEDQKLKGVESRILSAKNPLCVHVRWGDYKTTASGVYEILKEDYYRRAIETLGWGAEVFVFSDSEEPLQMISAVFPDAEITVGGGAVETMVLMSRCRMFIIGNSTFSWWAAYASGSDQVICPNRWFSGSAKEENSIEDLYPDGWILV